MQDPKKLKVRHEARTLAAATYRLTANFHPHERFGLASQMQRAAISVGSNISEGCGGQGERAMIAYLHHAVASLHALGVQVDVAGDLGYSSDDCMQELQSQLASTRRMIIGLLLVLRRRASPST